MFIVAINRGSVRLPRSTGDYENYYTQLGLASHDNHY